MRPIVVDANIAFAAFIRDGPTREIILDYDLDLRSPPWLWEEIASRYDWLIEKTRMSRPAFDELLRQIRPRITNIPQPAIEAKRDQALEMVPKSGRKDAPYIAAVLAVQGILWTQDVTLSAEAPVDTMTTAQLIAELNQ